MPEYLYQVEGYATGAWRRRDGPDAGMVAAHAAVDHYKFATTANRKGQTLTITVYVAEALKWNIRPNGNPILLKSFDIEVFPKRQRQTAAPPPPGGAEPGAEAAEGRREGLVPASV